MGVTWADSLHRAGVRCATTGGIRPRRSTRRTSGFLSVAGVRRVFLRPGRLLGLPPALSADRVEFSEYAQTLVSLRQLHRSAAVRDGRLPVVTDR